MKQDGALPRTPEDLERKYNLGKRIKELADLVALMAGGVLSLKKVKGLQPPEANTEAANKEYVDQEAEKAKSQANQNLQDHTGNKNNPHGVTAAQVGARPDTWMPTAAQVGARPNTWVPTASDVGARPATYTYASKNGGDCNSYLDETHLFVFNMANRPSAFNYGWFDVWRASGSGFSPNGAKPIIVQRFQNWQNPSRAWRTSTDGGSTWCEWMYDNPPCNGNKEYTTTERYLDKPVKTKVINLGTVAQGGTLTVAHNCSISVLVRANIVVGRFSVPYLYNGDPSNQYSITGYVNKDNVYVKNGSGNAANTVYVQIWYTT
jgi:hypothetical protein